MDWQLTIGVALAVCGLGAMFVWLWRIDQRRKQSLLQRCPTCDNDVLPTTIYSISDGMAILMLVLFFPIGLACFAFRSSRKACPVCKRDWPLPVPPRKAAFPVR